MISRGKRVERLSFRYEAFYEIKRNEKMNCNRVEIQFFTARPFLTVLTTALHEAELSPSCLGQNV
jgi:hypothetical protein